MTVGIPAHDYDTFMNLGIEAHGHGQHLTAEGHRLNALEAAETSVQKARALRDLSATYGYLELPEKAEFSARLSVELMVNDAPIRERGASKDRLSRVMARQLIQKELDEPSEPIHTNYTAFRYSAESWGDLRQSEKEVRNDRIHATLWPFSVDQYRINMAPRHAAISALFGDERWGGFITGMRGLVIAPFSENPLLATSNQAKIGFFNRLKRTGGDIVTAVGGLAVVALASPKHNRRRTTALKVADKLLH